jgi:hypothetical protein
LIVNNTKNRNHSIHRFGPCRLARKMCNAAKIVPDNKSGTPGLALWVPPAIERWLGSHVMRHNYQY